MLTVGRRNRMNKSLNMRAWLKVHHDSLVDMGMWIPQTENNLSTNACDDGEKQNLEQSTSELSNMFDCSFWWQNSMALPPNERVWIRDAPIVYSGKRLNETSKRLNAIWPLPVSSLQFNCHCQIEETLPVLTSDYTTDTVVWAVIILHDVPTKDRATCFSK